RGRHRRSDRASLRHAGHGLLQRTGDGPRLVRVLQHLRGNRQACRRHRTCAQAIRLGASMELIDLYRDVILDHNRRPRNFGALDPADASVEGFNPMCGDRLTVRLKMDDDTISDIRFEGQGCAISTASASLMTEAVKGRTRAEALRLFDRVHELLTDDG